MATIKELLNKASSPSPSMSSKETPSSSATPTPSPSVKPALLSPLPSATSHHNFPLPIHQARPRPKIIKDAPVFTHGPTRGPVRFPPQVYTTDTAGSTAPVTSPGASSRTSSSSSKSSRSSTSSKGKGKGKAAAKQSVTTIANPAANAITPQTLQAYHDKFSVYPNQATIADYPRHIPYNSEKRIFLDKTGRDFFEVFQFTFKIPTAGDGASSDPSGFGDDNDDGKMWTLLWDYNTGLVRTTPLFKCCGYGKTTPAKMLNKNVGLRDICHSITGGALVAQGYWIPHLAAKHIAATFCYPIRHALTPVFGIDFIDLCVPPSDERFGSMLINDSITVQCRNEAEIYKRYEAEFPTVRPSNLPASRAGSPNRSSPAPAKPSQLPLSSAYNKPGGGSTGQRFKPINDDSASGTNSSEVENSEADDSYVLSPTNTMSASSSPRFREVWGTSSTGKKGVGKVPRSHPRDDDLPSPKSGMRGYGGGHGKGKRNFDQFDEGWMAGFGSRARGFGGGVSAYSTPMQSPKMRKIRDFREGDVEDGYEAEGEEMEVDHIGGGGRRIHGGDKSGGIIVAGKKFGKEEAANALLSLYGLKTGGSVARRASA